MQPLIDQGAVASAAKVRVHAVPSDKFTRGSHIAEEHGTLFLFEETTQIPLRAGEIAGAVLAIRSNVGEYLLLESVWAGPGDDIDTLRADKVYYVRNGSTITVMSRFTRVDASNHGPWRLQVRIRRIDEDYVNDHAVLRRPNTHIVVVDQPFVVTS